MVWYKHAVSFIIFLDEELILKSWEIGCFWSEEWTSLRCWLQPAITPLRTWKDLSFSQVSNFKGHFWINETRGKFWKLLITCNRGVASLRESHVLVPFRYSLSVSHFLTRDLWKTRPQPEVLLARQHGPYWLLFSLSVSAQTARAPRPVPKSSTELVPTQRSTTNTTRPADFSDKNNTKKQ